MERPTPRTGSARIPVRIAGTGSVLPGRPVATAELVARVGGGPDAAAIEAKTGIISRHFAGAESNAAQLGAQALHGALAMAGVPAAALARIVFVDSFGGDVLAPATANLVAAALGLRGTCDCFDVNNACMGFLSAFDLSARSVATGHGPVGIVAAELISRYTTPDDPRPFLVLGDAVGAVVLDGGRPDEGILGWSLRNDALAGGDVGCAHPGITGRRETVRFASSSKEMTRHAIAAVRRSTEEALAQAGLELSEVQWILPHQPNGSLLDALITELGFAPDRVIRVVREVGSVGAASIAISLDRLWRSGRMRPGDRLLMAGVGAGISQGAIVFQVAT